MFVYHKHRLSNPTTRAAKAVLWGTLALLIVFSVARRGASPVMVRNACVVAAETSFPVGGDAPPLPRIIHQQWKNGPVPPPFQQWQRRMRDTFPDHQYMLWDDDAARKLLEEKYAWFLPVYDAFPANIMRVDAARCFILYEHGGLYADLDYEVLEDFWDRLPSDAPAFIESYWIGYEVRQNSFMSSPPKHPFWHITWQVMRERLDTGSTNPIFVTGPTMIDESVRRSGVDTTHTLPCENWHRPAVGVAGSYTSLKHRVWRNFAYAMGWFKPCGEVGEPNSCEFGIHHSTITWNL